MSNEPEFLTLMRAELKGAMSELKVDLIDRFAAKKDIEDVHNDLGEVHKRLGNLENWRNRIVGALALVTFSLPVVAALSWHIWA